MAATATGTAAVAGVNKAQGSHYNQRDTRDRDYRRMQGETATQLKPISPLLSPGRLSSHFWLGLHGQYEDNLCQSQLMNAPNFRQLMNLPFMMYVAEFKSDLRV